MSLLTCPSSSGTSALHQRHGVALVILMVTAACAGEPTAPLPTGIDATAWHQLAADVSTGMYGDVQSLLVTRGSAPPAERYFRGARQDNAVPVYSITKSVTSLLVGIAINDGLIAADTVPLAAVLPRYSDQLQADTQRRQMRVRDLLTMRAGIAWNEFSEPYNAPQHPLTLMFQSADWVGHVLGLPMAAAPGAVYAYNSGATLVLGAVVAATTQRGLRDFAQDRLFGPLGIPRPAWHTSSKGTVNAAAGLSLRPTDLVRIGQLVLNGGRYDHQQLVPTHWLMRSMQPVSNTYGATRYGYQWWLFGPTGAYSAAHPIYVAVGYGGQLLIIDPSLALIAVVTANAFDRDPVALALRLVPRFVALAGGHTQEP